MCRETALVVLAVIVDVLIKVNDKQVGRVVTTVVVKLSFLFQGNIPAASSGSYVPDDGGRTRVPINEGRISAYGSFGINSARNFVRL